MSSTGKILLCLILGLTTLARAEIIDTVYFDAAQLKIDINSASVKYANCRIIADSARPDISAANYRFHSGLFASETTLACRVLAADTFELGFAPATNRADIPTASDPFHVPPQVHVLDSDSMAYPKNCFLASTSKSRGRFEYSITLFPVQYLTDNRVVFNKAIAIESAGDAAALESGYPDYSEIKNDHFAKISGIDGGRPLGINYVVVTSPELAAAFEPFIDLKRHCGFAAAIAITDSIVAHYSGIDDAEALRSYLNDFYMSGGEYVLLGGDEDNVPVRYAYYYNTLEQPPLDQLMLCDMYFAEFDGDWDYDGDGVYGEPTQDHPDLGCEVALGRLPFSNQEQVTAYTDKLEKYLFDPGNGDASYLNRAVFFTADQMRDYFEGGQQYFISESFPPGFTADCELLAEDPTGNAEIPTGPYSGDGIDGMRAGFGMVNMLVHGRPDGFVVSSSGYNEAPKSYLLTGEGYPPEASFTSISGTGKPFFCYNIACDQAAYDLEKLYALPMPCVTEELTAIVDGGTVGTVAFTRWGWVGSSYKLAASFYTHLFGDAEGSAVGAMYRSWNDYPYYRDQIYGQNFYGDPSLNIYRELPAKVAIVSSDFYPVNDGYVEFDVKLGDQPLASAPVTVFSEGELIDVVYSDADGHCELLLPEGTSGNVTLTAYLPGSISAAKTLSPSIVADADDGDNVLPREFALHQNYPNPFNPATTIAFDLPRAQDVTLIVYDILGRRVRTLVDGYLQAGEHSVVWDSRDEQNAQVASGIYLYRISLEDMIDTRKMILLK